MKYIVYVALLAICTPGMLHMIDWGLLPKKYRPLRLLLVMLFLITFFVLGSLAFFRLWKW